MMTRNIDTRAEREVARTIARAREGAPKLADALAYERKTLPWVRVEQEYTLQAADGPTSWSKHLESTAAGSAAVNKSFAMPTR